MLRDETRASLQIFTSLAQQLRGSSFIEMIRREGASLTITLRADGGEIETTGPEALSDEARSFAGTLRQFLLKDLQSSRASFEVLQKSLGDPGLSQQWKNGFIEARRTLYKFLDETPNPEILKPMTRESVIKTQKDALDIFFYGEIFHHNRWEEIQALKAMRGGEQIGGQLFINALLVVYGIIMEVDTLSQQELARA